MSNITKKTRIYIECETEAKNYQVNSKLTYRYVEGYIDVTRPIGYHLQLRTDTVPLENVSIESLCAIISFIKQRTPELSEGYSHLWFHEDGVKLTYGDWLTIIQDEIQYRLNVQNNTRRIAC